MLFVVSTMIRIKIKYFSKVMGWEEWEMPKMMRECCWLERFWASLGQQKGPEPLAGVALQEEGHTGHKVGIEREL